MRLYIYIEESFDASGTCVRNHNSSVYVVIAMYVVFVIRVYMRRSVRFRSSVCDVQFATMWKLAFALFGSKFNYYN